jgi:hypothetical protein
VIGAASLPGLDGTSLLRWLPGATKMWPMTGRMRISRQAAAWATVGVIAMSGLVLAAGKPGYPDTIVWNGLTWQVKTSRSAVGPGPNLFDKANVSVDSDGRLHLRIAPNAKGTWTCAEIIAPTSYGYGTYTFELASRVDALDPNVVLGLFTWSDKAPYAHREIDIEFARWANSSDPTNAQYVVQPYDRPSHLKRFTEPQTLTSRHEFSWHPGQIGWASYDLTGGGVIDSYSYSGSDVPKSGDERVHLNLWLFNGEAPTNGLPVDVIVSSFTYAP